MPRDYLVIDSLAGQLLDAEQIAVAYRELAIAALDALRDAREDADVLRRNYDLAQGDLARYTASRVA